MNAVRMVHCTGRQDEPSTVCSGARRPAAGSSSPGRALVVALALAAAAAAGPARADEPHGPPLLTPAAALLIADACPDAAAYAPALVTGATRAQTVAAAPLFAQCARAVRLPDARWKGVVSAFALSAVQLSRGLLDHDRDLLAAVASATASWRAAIPVTDEQIRGWTRIPDSFDLRTRSVVYEDACPNLYVNAAYLNVAAAYGIAWIGTAREGRATSACVAAMERDVMSATFARGPAVPGAQVRPPPAPDERTNNNRPP